jgi:hypothetical protein
LSRAILDGGKNRFGTGVKNYAKHRPAFVYYPYANGKIQYPVRKIICTVYRVYHPPYIVIAAGRLFEDFTCRTLFADKAVVAEIPLNSVDYYLLTADIGLGNKLRRAFLGDFYIIYIFHRPPAGGSCGNNGSFEQAA